MQFFYSFDKHSSFTLEPFLCVTNNETPNEVIGLWKSTKDYPGCLMISTQDTTLFIKQTGSRLNIIGDDLNLRIFLIAGTKIIFKGITLAICKPFKIRRSPPLIKK